MDRGDPLEQTQCVRRLDARDAQLKRPHRLRKIATEAEVRKDLAALEV
jgi:hypothetical protein